MCGRSEALCANSAAAAAAAPAGAPRAGGAPGAPWRPQAPAPGAPWQIVPSDGRGSGFFETVEAESARDPQLLTRLQEALSKFGARRSRTRHRAATCH
jgi:hypothetical protein